MLTRFLAPLAFLIGLGAVASAQVTVNHHSGFLSPTGMHGVQGSSMGSGFIVSEAGTGANDGRVTFLEDGTFNRQTVVAALPSIISEGFASGPHDATLSNNNLYVALGKTLDPALNSTVVRFDLNATPWSLGMPPLTAADIAEIIPVGAYMASQGYADSNVFSVVLGRKNNLFIADAGANAVVRYDFKTASLSVYLDIPGEPNPTSVGPPIIDAVPTRLRWDGKTLRVSTLTGFPFLPGLAKIYAIDAGKQLSIEKDGLTLVTGFDYDPTNGRLVVTELASSFDPVTGFAPDSGSVVEFARSGERVPISVGAALPTVVMHKPDGTPFYASLGDGVMYRIDPGAMNFCITSRNSVGTGAIMSHSGSVSVQANDLALRCDYLPVDEFGLFFYGSAPTMVPLGGGYRCVGGPKLFRLGIMKSNQAGVAFCPVDNTALAKQGSFIPGSVWQFQYWYRDKGIGAGSSLSDGLQVMFTD
ncbi:MAG TPA: ScyD/ScyE family protein [Planctomycetes bacterium]|nr:ScyD/ScyE family protein [Planctomycetota bacterium]HIK59696.1 ScyD/ScyE family protein [Planctomycetota bacterium]